MLGPPRYDFTFSYWILAWFFLYYNRIVPYNPKSWFILGLVHNAITVLIMMYYHYSIVYMLIFIAINVVIKILPLWLLRRTTMLWCDFLFGCALFALHLLWLSANDSSYPDFLKDGLKRIRRNEPVGPTEYYIVAGSV